MTETQAIIQYLSNIENLLLMIFLMIGFIIFAKIIRCVYSFFRDLLF